MAEEPELEGDGDEEGEKIGGGLAHGDAGAAEQPRQPQEERRGTLEGEPKAEKTTFSRPYLHSLLETTGILSIL